MSDCKAIGACVLLLVPLPTAALAQDAAERGVTSADAAAIYSIRLPAVQLSAKAQREPLRTPPDDVRMPKASAEASRFSQAVVGETQAAVSEIPKIDLSLVTQLRSVPDAVEEPLLSPPSISLEAR